MMRINMRKSVYLVVLLGVMVMKVHARGETSTSTTTVVTSSNTETSSGSKLANEQGAAAMAAREGRELAKEESEGASGLTRREKAEERHLQKEISMSDGSSSSGGGGLSQADRQADAKVRAQSRHTEYSIVFTQPHTRECLYIYIYIYIHTYFRLIFILAGTRRAD